MYFPLNLKKSENLIETFIKRIKALSEYALKKYPNKNLKRDPIIICIMVNNDQIEEFKEYLEKNDYFGYKTIMVVGDRTKHINVFDDNY